jgi:CubicO group peptidase (beta-lactamase class C family)
VIKDSQVVACLAVGINNPETGDRPRLDHHLNIGSVSKVLTAMLISQFVARDVISYDTKISDVFPSIALKYPNSPFRTATLRQLIAHTSGITKAIRFDTSDTADGKSWRLKHVEYALASNQTVPPNTSYEYSNAGPVIATAMVEQMLSQSPLKEELGASYEDWLAGIPGKALGLTNPKMLNYAVPPSADEVQPNYILDSGFRANHKLGKESFQYAPQGSCSITLTDLCRFSVVMMTNGMQLPQLQYRSAFSELVPHSKNTTGGWGLGINSKFVDHNGDTGRGEYAYLRLHPTRKLSIIFYTNGNIENRDQSRVFRGEITSEIAKLLDRL